VKQFRVIGPLPCNARISAWRSDEKTSFIRGIFRSCRAATLPTWVILPSTPEYVGTCAEGLDSLSPRYLDSQLPDTRLMVKGPVFAEEQQLRDCQPQSSASLCRLRTRMLNDPCDRPLRWITYHVRTIFTLMRSGNHNSKPMQRIAISLSMPQES
jgi:hypothetical protein